MSTTLRPGSGCPITQGKLVQLAIRVGACSIDRALALLDQVTSHHNHRFWPDAISHSSIRWDGVIGHRQGTDAYLAGLARKHRGKLASFDAGLVTLHAGVGVALPA